MLKYLMSMFQKLFKVRVSQALFQLNQGHAWADPGGGGGGGGLSLDQHIIHYFGVHYHHCSHFFVIYRDAPSLMHARSLQPATNSVEGTVSNFHANSSSLTGFASNNKQTRCCAISHSLKHV